MPNFIQPRTLKGFRDFLPESMVIREHLIQQAREVFKQFGFAPIDTPVLEYAEILTGKGSDETDRQMYAFEDHGKRKVGMRFDLTVPLARFAAQHVPKLGTPFKRYHIAPVWRGENTQSGRYREFMQCDFDTIGTESVVADVEIGLVIHRLLQTLNVGDFTIRINNREVLNGILEWFGVSERLTPVLRCLDKLEKAGAETVQRELETSAELSAAQSEDLVNFVQSGADLDLLESKLESSQQAVAGIKRLRQMSDALLAAGVAEDCFQLDLTIARGLDYYTGMVFETNLDDLPGIGSVCSGGRYDNLAGLYTKQHLPGVGASLGLDRLLAALEELQRLPDVRPVAEVFLPYFAEDRLADYLRLASHLRDAGISVELYPEPKRLGQQLKYADQRGFSIAVIAGSEELDAGNCQIKDLRNNVKTEVSLSDVVSGILSMRGLAKAIV